MLRVAPRLGLRSHLAKKCRSYWIIARNIISPIALLQYQCMKTKLKNVQKREAQLERVRFLAFLAVTEDRDGEDSALEFLVEPGKVDEHTFSEILLDLSLILHVNKDQPIFALEFRLGQEVHYVLFPSHDIGKDFLLQEF